MKAIEEEKIINNLDWLAEEGYIDIDDVPPIKKMILGLDTFPITLKGHWNTMEDGSFVCNKCGSLASVKTHFCPACGSYMGEKKC